MLLKEYYDSKYGKVKIISILEFEQTFFPKHENCNADSEIIIDEPHLHIERIYCYDHNQDWFVQITESVLQKIRNCK